ncbi:Uncharacterised protein [Collinsella intestinalis]|nr:Uncharacterised protein [Collinsella intestinalis]
MGQLTSSGPRRRRPSDCKIPQHTGGSSTGSAVRLTRIVSPMPSASNTPRPTALLIVPCCTVPASVTPRCSGTWGSSRESARYVSIVVGTLCALAESTISSNPRFSKCSTNSSDEATSFSGCVRSSRSAIRLSSEPALTPMRMAAPASPAASITASTRSQSPMLPGLMRSLAAPARTAPIARR